ncbi:hypothetical protein [Duganella sp. S19_KUP01_CR8]|uniref:hypothetical protein n=1 Tax=Duganella sp. S19_KUP01_CR8 TaxID=3025502 RepID=UPI002FCD9F9A
MRPRENTRLADAIQHAIIIDATAGAAHAWAFLSALDVPDHTILRVLSDRARRRDSDQRVPDRIDSV